MNNTKTFPQGKRQGKTDKRFCKRFLRQGQQTTLQIHREVSAGPGFQWVGGYQIFLADLNI